MRFLSTRLVSGCLFALLGAVCGQAFGQLPGLGQLPPLNAAANGAYKGLYFDNDFSYLEAPGYNDWHLGEGFKRRRLGDWAVLDIGGEYRARGHFETNMRGLGLTGLSDSFLLQRTRVYANAEVGERVRVFAEMRDATSDFENFGARGIEVNRYDFLNLFGDLDLIEESARGAWKLRVGRQELLYGDQRLVSPLDWANTRRTFDGVKLMGQGEDWKVDAFWTRPVINAPFTFDSPFVKRQFYGVYASTTRVENQTFDAYWLGYEDDAYVSPNTPVTRFTYQTLGSRWLGTRGPWQATVEGGVQFGKFGPLDHLGAFFTGGIGYTWEDAFATPTLWGYYDWASPGQAIGDGFDHLFPLGHKYFGFMDFYARSNIQDLNFVLTATPHSRLRLLAWWHCFFLADAGKDVPYNVLNRPIVGVTGGNPYLGQEIDLTATWIFSERTDLLIGYSHFFTGSWYKTNAAAAGGFQGDANFTYTQFSVRF